jgi:hypothetical protein
LHIKFSSKLGKIKYKTSETRVIEILEGVCGKLSNIGMIKDEGTSTHKFVKMNGSFSGSLTVDGDTQKEFATQVIHIFNLKIPIKLESIKSVITKI